LIFVSNLIDVLLWREKLSDKNKTVKTVSYIMIITLFGKVLALIRDMLLARFYGSGMDTSAFLTASRIPRVLFDAIFASAITSSFIPIFNKVLKKDGQDKAYEFSDVFITIVALFMTALMIISMIFAKNIAFFFADGFDEKTLELCTNLLIILLPTMICTGIAFSFVGILQSMEHFLIPALISVVFNVVIIGYYFTFNNLFGIHGLAFVYLIGWILQVAIQVPSLIKIKYKYHFRPYFSYPYMKDTLVLMLPVMISTWVQPFNIMINAKYASRLYKGAAVPAIEFANNLYTMIAGVLVLSIMNFIFPKLSKLIHENKEDEFNQTVKTTILSTLFLVVPLCLGVMSLSRELIALIYGGNKFDDFSISITSTALFCFSAGMVGYSLQNILSRVYFSKESGRMPMISAIIAIVINYIFCNLFIKRYEIGGLAVSSTISVTVNALILAAPFFNKKYKIFDLVFFVQLGKIFICSFAMSAVILVLKAVLGFDTTVAKLMSLSIIFVVAVGFYFILAIILKIDQMDFVKGRLNKK
jgi:integral membrane protein mviN